MSKGFFITGTDTGIGKTWITAGLLRAFARHGYRTLALKPVASGCEQVAGELRNEDARILMAHATEILDYPQVNPCALALPVSPHLAATAQGTTIDIDKLATHCRTTGDRADIYLVEGVGGWRAPLNTDHTVADLARVLELPAVLVVGIRLGCLNHALLSWDAMKDEITMAGWVANVIDPQCLMQEEVVATLQERLDIPCLGTVPAMQALDADRIAMHLDIATLLEE